MAFEMITESSHLMWGNTFLSGTKLTITKGAKLLAEPNKLPESFTSRESVDFVGLWCLTVSASAQKAIAVINSDSVVL